VGSRYRTRSLGTVGPDARRYPDALGLMVALALGLWALFKRKGRL
jgi:hypothetical protein